MNNYSSSFNEINYNSLCNYTGIKRKDAYGTAIECASISALNNGV